MTATIMTGKEISENILAELAPRVKNFTQKFGRPPTVAALSSGDDAAAGLYTRQQLKLCAEIGLGTRIEKLSASCKESDLAQSLETLSADDGIDGIILESPLPPQVSVIRLLAEMPAEKDVEGLSPFNYGRLFECKSYEEIKTARIPLPPTAHAVITLLLLYRVPIAGRHAVVIGRSNVVGKPAAHLLASLDATVTLCHSKTRNLKELLKTADIIVAAAGKANFIRAADIKKGAAIADAGVNYRGKKILGDVDPACASKAKFISPVPGGVGPVTTALLLSNAVLCAERRRNIL